jgi:hypothetical protein
LLLIIGNVVVFFASNTGALFQAKTCVIQIRVMFAGSFELQHIFVHQFDVEQVVGNFDRL